MLPKAILFDLDDTLISAYSQPHRAWLEIAREFIADLHPCPPAEAAAAINHAADIFWADAERHRVGRLQLLDARALIIADGFAALAKAGHTSPGEPVARRMAARYNAYREEQMHLFDGAHHVIDTFRAKGVRLALITNGAAEPQRAKVIRFDLTHRFHHIQIEGEHGFGKPEERAYLHALSALGVEASDTWIVGDNLEWEVIAPQRLGLHAIWHDVVGEGVPAGSLARPDRVIRSLPELLVGIV
ncbi:MAG: HAD family hydrolase [Acetobacteraceae bacterium]|nr:HAD family hydrolase [Acetobacteraceae bacterium]